MKSIIKKNKYLLHQSFFLSLGYGLIDAPMFDRYELIALTKKKILLKNDYIGVGVKQYLMKLD